MRKNINWNCFVFFVRFCLVFYNCLVIDEKEKEILIWVVFNIIFIKRWREKVKCLENKKGMNRMKKKYIIKCRNR